jgi:hypothetical protein
MADIYALNAMCPEQKTFYEKCSSHQINCEISTDSLFKKLGQIQKLCPDPINGIYTCGGLSWPMDLIDIVQHEKTYPSSYFIKCVQNMIIVDCQNPYIANPPMFLPKAYVDNFDFIVCTHNKLAILNSLFEQGSQPTYDSVDGNQSSPKIYSEHSGVLKLVGKDIDNIIVSTKSQIVNTDDGIYLPKNTVEMSKHKYLFHTHPNAKTYGGRIKTDGVVYELPSINDILNFLKFSLGAEGEALASIVITPEGTYIIRKLKLNLSTKKVPSDAVELYQKAILKIESDAISRLKNTLAEAGLKFSDLHNPNIFHKYVSHDLTAINSYNKLISNLNIFVEYYPRVEINGMWRLHTLHLPWVCKF